MIGFSNEYIYFVYIGLFVRLSAKRYLSSFIIVLFNHWQTKEYLKAWARKVRNKAQCSVKLDMHYPASNP